MAHIRTLMDEMIQIDEGRMKDIFTANQEGESAEEIAKKLKLPLKTVKSILGESNLRYSVKFSYSKGGKIANAFYQDKSEAEKFMKSVIAKGGKAIMTTEEVKEDAPANAVGDGSAVAMPPAHEPGVHVKKKKKTILGLLKREDYNRVELENVINKICTNQEIEENQIKPIVNNIKSKKEKGTYTEQFGMRAFRYVVDTEITETVSEEYRNKIASSLLAKYE